MNEYSGKSEHVLRDLLDDCSNFQERRKIRAAIRELQWPTAAHLAGNPARFTQNGVASRSLDRVCSGTLYDSSPASRSFSLFSSRPSTMASTSLSSGTPLSNGLAAHRDSRFVSASVFGNAVQSRLDALSNPDIASSSRAPAQLHVIKSRKGMSSSAENVSGSLGVASEASAPPSADVLRHFRVRSSHVFLSNGETSCSQPNLAYPREVKFSVFGASAHRSNCLPRTKIYQSDNDDDPGDGRQTDGVAAGNTPLDDCEDEDELLDLLCTTEDIKERLKIRSRLKHLKEAREDQRAGGRSQKAPGPSHKLPSTTIIAGETSQRTAIQQPPYTQSHGASTPLGSQAEDKRSTRFSHAAKTSEVSQVTAKVANSGLLTDDSSRGKTVEKKTEADGYDHIQDMEELRQLLYSASQQDEKRKIRTAMRQLRRKEESGRGTSSASAPTAAAAKQSSRKEKEHLSPPANLQGSDVPSGLRSRSALDQASSLTKSQSLRTERKPTSDASDCYTPFERRPSGRSQAGKREKELSSPGSRKSQQAVSRQTVTTTSSRSRDNPSARKQAVPEISKRSELEEEKKKQQSHLTNIVNEKIKAALNENLYAGQSESVSSSSARKEKAGAPRKKSDKSLLPGTGAESDSKRSSTSSKSFASTLRGSSIRSPLGKTLQTETVSAGTRSQEGARRGSISKEEYSVQKQEKLQSPNELNETSKTLTIDDSSQESYGRLTRSSFSHCSRERSIQGPPASPGQVGSLPKDREIQSPVPSGKNSSSQERPAKLQLKRSPSPLQADSGRDKRSPSPLQAGSGRDKCSASPLQAGSGRDKRSPSPFQSWRTPSPFLSEGPALDRKPPSPLQTTARPHVKRPSSPFLSEGTNRLHSLSGERDRAATSSLSSEEQKSVNSCQSTGNTEFEEKEEVHQDQVIVSKVKTSQPSSQSSRSRQSSEETSSRNSHPDFTVSSDANEISSKQEIARNGRGSVSDVFDPPKESTKSFEEQEVNNNNSAKWKEPRLSLQESINWDFVNKVKARLHSRTESLSSETKYQEALHSRTCSENSRTCSEDLDSDSGKVVESKDMLRTGDKSSREPGPSNVPSVQQAESSNQNSFALQQRQTSEPKYKELRKLISDTCPVDLQVKASDEAQRKNQLSQSEKIGKGLQSSGSRNGVNALNDKFTSADASCSQQKNIAFHPSIRQPLPSSEDARAESSRTEKSESYNAGEQGEAMETKHRSCLPLRANFIRDSHSKSTTIPENVSVAATEAEICQSMPDVKNLPSGSFQKDRESHVEEFSKNLDPSQLNNSKSVNGEALRETDSKYEDMAETHENVAETHEDMAETHEDITETLAKAGVLDSDKITAPDGVQVGNSFITVIKDIPEATETPLTLQKSNSEDRAMEQAFSALLEDMETLSASGGTGSEADLSDGDETFTGVKDSGPTLEEHGPSSLKDSENQLWNNSADTSDPSTAKKSGSLVSGGDRRTLVPVAEAVEDGGMLLDEGEDVETMMTTTKEDSGIGLGSGDLDESSDVETAELSGNTDILRPALPALTDDDRAVPLPAELLSTVHEEEDSTTHRPRLARHHSLPARPAADMRSSAFVVLKPLVVDSAAHPDSPNLDHSLTILEDSDGGVTFQQSTRSEQQNRIVTIRSQVRRTPSDASEELRDTIVETTSYTPGGGAAVKERDVIRDRRKITSRGSNYYQRSAQHTRRVRDKAGADVVEHDLCVETDNTSVSGGRSWGDKTVTKLTLDNPSGELPPVLEDLADLPRLEADSSPRSKAEVKDLLPSSNRSFSVPHKIQGAPEILTMLKEVSVLEGQMAVLECAVAGRPKPEVKWYFNDTELSASEELFRKQYDELSGKATLTLLEVSLEDAGVYTCLCSNQHGDASTRSSLSVKRCDAETTVVPMFLTKLTSQTLSDGDPLILECEVIGSPEPTVEWRKDGLDLPSTLSFSSQYDGRVACLQVDRVGVENRGLYQCMAENTAGKVSVDARISVHKKSQVPSSFLSYLQDVQVDSGQPINLQCRVAGSPPPSVFWRRNEQLVVEAPDLQQSLDQGLARLHIPAAGLGHSGQYQCVARNDGGEVACSCHLSVNVPKDTELPPQETPQPPRVTRRSFKKLSEPHPSDIIEAILTSAGKRSNLQRPQSFSPGSLSLRDSVARLPTASPLAEQSLTGDKSLRRDKSPLRNFVAATEDSASVLSSNRDVNGNEVEQRVNRYSVQWTDSSEHVTVERDRIVLSPSASCSAPVPSLGRRDLSPSSSTSWQSRQLKQLSGQDTDSVARNVSLFPGSSESPNKIRHPPDRRSYGQCFGEREIGIAKQAEEAGPRSMVSLLKAQFAKLEDQTRDRGAGSGVRRAHSMPLSHERPSVVVKRGPSQLAAAPVLAEVSQGAETTATMSSYDQINDEEELHKMMNATDSFDERKKIRARLRDIRDKQRADMEVKRQQREKETEDLVRKKFEMAEEEKKRKMQSYSSQKPTCERDTEYHSASQKLIEDKYKQAEQEKQKKLEAYKNISQREHQSGDGQTSVRTTTTSSSKTSDGSTTVTKKTETTSIKQTSGFGGVQYGAPTRLAPDSLRSDVGEDGIGEEEPKNENPGSEENVSKLKEAEENCLGIASDSILANLDAASPPMENPPSRSPLNTSPGSGEKQENVSEDTNKSEDSGKTQALTKEEVVVKEDSTNKDASSKKEAENPVSSQEVAEKEPQDKVDSTKADQHKEESSFNQPSKDDSKKQSTVVNQTDLDTRKLEELLNNVSGPGSSGSITVRTESWNSRDGLVHKAQKNESWGAKPQGASGARAAFQQMDAASPGAKPNGLVTVALAKRAASTMRKNVAAIKEEILSKPMARSPSAIKQVLLDWCKAMTKEYENIEVTNFSSSWNNGLAFCALIHHFFPDAFDYSQLDAKNRRYNFNLAFDTAEKLADISPLLDVEDMVKMKNPDWKCVFTYVQSIYRHLRDHENNKTKASVEA